MSEVVRDVYWRPWEDPGLEHLHLSVDSDGAQALGLILRMQDGQHFRCRYTLSTDPEWRVRQLTIAMTPAEGGPGQRLELESDGDGHWRADGAPRPDLEGCRDVDIQVTPFTNTLPVRRLGLAEGDSADIRVAYVAVPDVTVTPAEQRYTCLASQDADGGRYRYDGLFRNFTADLPVDGDGLVMDYPETFRRVWPT